MQLNRHEAPCRITPLATVCNEILSPVAGQWSPGSDLLRPVDILDRGALEGKGHHVEENAHVDGEVERLRSWEGSAKWPEGTA